MTKRVAVLGVLLFPLRSRRSTEHILRGHTNLLWGQWESACSSMVGLIKFVCFDILIDIQQELQFMCFSSLQTTKETAP